MSQAQIVLNTLHPPPYKIDIMGCEYTIISSTWFICPDEVVIINVIYSRGNSPGCDSLEQKIREEGSFFADEIATLVSNIAQDKIMGIIKNDNALSNNYNCDSTPCVPNSYVVRYVEAYCYFRCSKTTYTLPGSEGGNNIEISDLPCGESCCQRVTPFCIDGESICYGEVRKVSIGDCGDVIPYECDDFISNKLQDCSHPCNRL